MKSCSPTPVISWRCAAISALRRNAPSLLVPALALLLAGAAAPDSRLNAAVFDKAWTLVGKRYWDPTMHGLDWQAMRSRYRPQAIAAPDTLALYAVLDEMLDALGDSHVYAVTPAERRVSQQADPVELGFSTSQGDDGLWRIDAVKPGGPAAAAGVQIGWQLLSMAGRPIDMHYHPADGEEVPLVLKNDAGGLLNVALRGARLDQDDEVRAKQLPGEVMLIRLPGFDTGADRWLVRQLGNAPPRALILDLRDNEGGRSDVLDRIAGAFFERNRPVLRVIKHRPHDEMTRGAGRASFKGPLIVLVGPHSASAAEAFAALIEESGRGVTVGERTAGSLEDSVRYRLPDGGELSVAEADIRTPAGHRLEGVGFMPRHLIKPSLEQRRAGEDPVLQFAQRLLADGSR